MKKFIIIGFVFVMLLAMSAMASETRVMTMGDNNNVLIDDANIWLYPSTIVQHGNLFSAELGYYNDEFDIVGANWKLGNSNNGVLGTYFSTQSSSDRIHLFYGQNMGANNIGIHLNAEQSSWKNEGTNLDEFGESYYDLTVGFSEGGGQWDVAFNFATGSYQYTDVAGVVYEESDGISQLGLYGRYWKVRNPNYTQVYHIGFMTEKYGWTEPTASPVNTYADKWMTIDAGCGFNFTPSSHVLAVFDFGVMLEKYTYEDSNDPEDYTEKTTAIPYFKLGMDGEVFKWLDVRIGATSYWNNYKEEYSTDTYSRKYADNNSYLGLGFNWGNLHVDTEANPEFFLDGPDFLSGADEDLNWEMSVTYDM